MNFLYSCIKHEDHILIRLKKLSISIAYLVPTLSIANKKCQYFELNEQLSQTSQEFFTLCEEHWSNDDVQRIAWRMAPLIG